MLRERIVYIKLLVWLLLSTFIASCQEHDAISEQDTLFRLVPPESSGVDFTNTLQESPKLNILNYLYYYNGGGVAVGDVNNDSLPDIYFTANEQPNQLYLNRGNLQFEDISETAGVTGQPGWTTGVSMADVNGDGLLDIYVSQVGAHEGLGGHNQLYINQGADENGLPHFTEEAAAYGLDIQSYGTQAAFFDYDRDGDLDVYLLNHTVHSPETYVPTRQGRVRSPLGDRLMRNDGNKFTDVSEEAGIYGSIVGYGLSVSIADINADGWPDIYVGNDFHENDYLYLNNGSGPDGKVTFTESLEQVINHTSRFSMGHDIADINNDGRLDIAVLDMKPEDERVLKISAGEDPYDIYQYKLQYGYNHQYARNTLQLQVGDSLFSEIGQLAGVDATDWSWSALFADLDNDGWKDLFISNGIYRRPNNKDYIDFISNQEIQASLNSGDIRENMSLVEKMPTEPVANYAYRNRGDLTFDNEADKWGLAQPGFSNGTAYADLDNDGDLDLVINNVNAVASIYENRSSEKLPDHHYLRLKLEAEGKNTFGLGARVWVYAGGQTFYQEQSPVRGFQSSVEPVIHFGLGRNSTIDSLRIIWNDGRQQLLEQPKANQVLTLKQADAKAITKPQDQYPLPKVFEDVTQDWQLPYRHQENNYIDFNSESLIPHMLSQEGPALAVADVNGDGREDIFAGGAAHQPAQLLLQKANGGFAVHQADLWRQDQDFEDVNATFFDADGDGDQDLYVASAGNQTNGPSLQDRLYLNDGRGNFSRRPEALPKMNTNTACVSPVDFDRDGDMDLFVGGRSIPGRYGLIPRSYLLQNDGQGNFTDVTEQIAPELAEAGMLTAAVWMDYNADGWQDLVIVGTWMPVTVFKNQQGEQLAKVEAQGLEKSHGWWNTLAAADMDGDGDMDLLAGNLGLNSVIKANEDEPAELYIKDFDENGSLDHILTFYKNGISYPFANKAELTKQIVSLRKKYLTYADYADSQVEDIFSKEQLSDAEKRQAYHFASSYIENLGNGNFKMHHLPQQAQFAPVNALAVNDFNGDQISDVVLAGNSDAVGPKQGRYDASYGLLLLGRGDGTFDVQGPEESGLVVKGVSRKVLSIKGPYADYLIFGKNNDAPQVYRVQLLLP
ncbi:MAG: VCBS repeat-containing protein [Cyclobacteriaceae bacterium]